MYVKAKMIPVETVPGMGVGRNNGEQQRGDSKCDIFDTL
jgi:hypothetical protein